MSSKSEDAVIEVAPGLWVRPRHVRAVRTTREYTHGAMTLKAAVHVYIADCEAQIGWEFEEHDAALEWAARIVGLINAARKA